MYCYSAAAWITEASYTSGRLCLARSILSPVYKIAGAVDKIDRAVDFVASVYGAGEKSQVHEY